MKFSFSVFSRFNRNPPHVRSRVREDQLELYDFFYGFLHNEDSAESSRFRKLCNIPITQTRFVQEKTQESDAELNEAFPPEQDKVKGKAEKSQLKKLRLKERKRLKKLEKTKSNMEEEDNTKIVDKMEHSIAKPSTSANDLHPVASDKIACDSDESYDCEGLDMKSSFVNKAAQRVQSKMDQKPKLEKKEKKKPPPPKNVLPKEGDEADDETCDVAFEDNVKISNKIAAIGNDCASAGQFDAAVQNFTKAIQYNPTEYKFYGNRSFCFEKLKKYEKALADAEVSLNLCPGWTKGFFRKGRALAGLKRHEEAAQAFQEVLNLDNTCIEASQEMMKEQILQLMEGGFTRTQCTNALLLHGTVQKARELLNELRSSELNTAGGRPFLPDPAVGASGVPKPLELFPIWVGNLSVSVTEWNLNKLFSKAGFVYSLKLLTFKQCAFINFTQQESCQEAINRFNGYELMGSQISVRYPDRMPVGMGISKLALKARDVRNDSCHLRACLPLGRHIEVHKGSRGHAGAYPS
ncbi:tetratricopeptide repeat protein 31-like isoform X2 [Dunckerocampus dactyliophorus]|uniref:tetratricopeptide repeat protein 31-like isoform X2 n=1 Tax=Dunckerocampus dactyliophorus TaxID=161453 RepID=UPI002404C753|nr:tetratricopeptide repeat protein 31-like isoform X2 [Dunckerocampus dactyliophorus]